MPPRKKPPLTLSPGIQNLITQINANQPQVDPETPGGDGGGIFGGAFRKASNFAAERAGDLATGVGYAMRAIDLSRQYVAKPVLGAGLWATNDGKDAQGNRVDIGSVNDLRTYWNEADVNPVVRFVAEMAADPLMYTGIGLWQSPTMKFAKAVSPMMLGGTKIGLKGRVGEVLVNPIRHVVGRSTRLAKAEYGFSTGARKSLDQLAKKQALTGGQVDELVKESVRTGLVKADEASNVAMYLMRAMDDPAKFAGALKPGPLARLTEPLRLSRIFSPMDMLFENMWQAPFAALGPVIAPLAGPVGRGAARAIDRMGREFPIRQFAWLGSRLGPEVGHDVYAAAKAGKLATYIMQPTQQAVELETARVVNRARLGVAQAANDLRLDPYEVIQALRLNHEGITQSLPMDDFARDMLSRTLGPSTIPDTQFAKLMKLPNEEQVWDGIQAYMQREMTEGLVKVPGVAPEALTLPNKFWGWTSSLVNRWRPLVTTYNPSFIPLNIFDDIFGRGGGGLVVGSADELTDMMVRHGYPADLTSGVRDDLWRLLKKAKEQPSPEEVEAARRGLTRAAVKVGGESIETISKSSVGVTQMGIRHIGKSRVGRFAHAVVLKADQGAQLEIAQRGASQGFLRRVLEADVTDDLHVLKKYLMDFRSEGNINPMLLDEVERLSALAVTRPKQASKLIGEKFNYENIVMADVESSTAFRAMPQEWQDTFKVGTQMALDDGVPMRNAVQLGIDKADRTITTLDNEAMRQAVRPLAHAERVLEGAFDDLGFKGLRAARKDATTIARETMQGYANAVSEFNTTAATRYMKKRILPTSIALRQVDMATYSLVAKSAQANGMTGMLALPQFQAWNSRTTKQIARRMGKLTDQLDKYAMAMRAGDSAAAKKSLRAMARQHGDFSEFVNAETLPLPEMIFNQYRITGERIWNQFAGAKFEVADAMTAMFGRGSLNPSEMTTLFQKAQNEVFQQGNVAAMRAKWSQKMADISGLGDQVMPINTKGMRAELEAMIRQGEIAQVPEEQLIPFRQRLQDLTDNPPTRPVQQFFLDMQNNYEVIGRSTIESASKLMPDEFHRLMLESSGAVRAHAAQVGLNEAQDQAGVMALHKFFEPLFAMNKNKRLVQRVGNAYRNAVQEDGIPLMRQRMVDYTRQTNLHRSLSAILPFASFQLHLPPYLARTFMERPGVIAAMNHFAQDAQEQHGITGGMMFGEGLYFAPQLRFSFLPIMAGNNFVRPEDNPVNQMNDMLSLFGFSPGPNIQMMGDVMNRFAEQSGFNRALGIEAAAPEFRGGLVPQWRFLQDVTALFGVDNGRGLNIPWVGPSGDLREREVRRALTGRLAQRTEEFKTKFGRNPWPDEVQALRDSVWENEITDVRKEVAARDIPAFLMPGLKWHDPDYLQVRERAALWMSTHGVEATSRDVVFKYRSLNTVQKNQLRQEVPEFNDVLSIPPWQESGMEKTVRQAREGFFKNRDIVMSNTAQEQRKIDAALQEGGITPTTYRDLRSTLRTTMSNQLTMLEQNPDYEPFMRRERVMPTEPQEIAYMDYNKLEPQDLNENGVIDEEDMTTFFDARRVYLLNQPEWVRDYIRDRREVQMTPTEIEFTRTQALLNDFFDIPKYQGMTRDDGNRADDIIAQARTFASAAPGRQSLEEIVMMLPDLSSGDKILALRALTAGRDPRRWQFWNQNRDLAMWYPDLAPRNPFTVGGA